MKYLPVLLLLYIASLIAGDPTPQPNPDVTFHQKPKPLPAGAVTHDWTTFLGPAHNCTSTETKLLKKWPEGGPPLVWELKRGPGYASPAIKGERLVYFHRAGDSERIECLHPETGERYWLRDYPTTYQDRYGYNNGPRSSPVIDDDRVYLLGVQGILHCLKLNSGEVIWKKDISAEFSLKQDFFGIATTPLIEKDLLIINTGAPGGPGVVALNKLNGNVVWKADTGPDAWGPSYASPIPATIHGKRRILVFGGGESRPPTGGLLCINPDDGHVDFRYPWRSKTVESVNASCPVIVDDHVFISASYETGGAMLKITPDFKHEVVWTSADFGTHWMTAVHKDGHLYGFEGRHLQNSKLVCFEWKTGTEKWRQNLAWQEKVVYRNIPRAVEQGHRRGTLLSVDDHFLALGEEGHLQWLDLTPQGVTEISSRAWLFPAQETWCLPVLSRGLVYICQNHQGWLKNEPMRLFCYDLRAAE